MMPNPEQTFVGPPAIPPQKEAVSVCVGTCVTDTLVL